MTNLSSPLHTEVTRLPSGHYRLDATRLSLQELAPLLRCLHDGCPHCQVVFLTPTGPQTFSVAASAPADEARSCSLVQCSSRGG